MTPTTITAQMVLHQLEFFVFLGWEQAERAAKQRITIDIHLEFAELPAACITDNLADTLCYDTLKQTIHHHLAHKEFHLLEHLTYDIFTVVKNALSLQHKIMVCVTKYPDSFFKSSGVSFWYGDHQQVRK